jgi:hypothetical protein
MGFALRTSVDAANRTLVTQSGNHKASVANVIAPQKAARIAERAGVTDPSGWCPVEPVAFESRQQPNIHVIGDAATMDAMPKSAFSANARQRYAPRLSRGSSPARSRISRSSSIPATASSPRITASRLRVFIVLPTANGAMSKAQAA